jgi:PAS domain S-box-containing protein
MSDLSTTATAISIDQQIQELGKVAEQIYTRLYNNPNIKADDYEGLSLLATRLDTLSQRIKRNEEERDNLLAVADISQIVNSSLDLNTVLQIVMDTIIRLTEAERGFLMLKNEAGELENRMARNWERESIHPSEFDVSRTIINRVARENKAVLTTNAQEDPRFGGQESIVAYSLRSILCVPMTVKGSVTGVIYADNRIRTGLFTEAERNLLTGFANQAAIAIENARLFESVRKTLAEVTALKNLMDNVFASIASGVITADVEDRILLCNQAARQILGREVEHILGYRLDQLLHPIAESLNEYVASARRDGTSVIGQEFKLELPDRGRLDLSLNISPLKDARENTQGVAIVLDDLTEKKRLESQRKLFERMVSPQVIAQLNPEALQLGGKRAEITALFMDVRGFTSFSEATDPEKLINILNRYLSVAADAVMGQVGTIDKFMGDGIMAWFNAPIPQPDHCLRAVRAAVSMRDGVQALHRQLPPDEHMHVGVGIHFGDAVLGLVGTEARLEYTAIGDSVNTAKRIQENSAPEQILISAPAYELVRDMVNVRPVEHVHAKGKREPVAVFEVLGLR